MENGKMEHHLRTLGFIEALSMIALLFIAMPIKYIGGNPLPVRWVGSVHGALFILFVVAATIVSDRRNWQGRRLILAYVAAVLPFGAFIFDRKIFPDARDGSRLQS